jgi:uncharacterized protein YbjT (DUF2867 family)
MSKKVIAVTGATGAQGGGLVRAILADPNCDFSARAVTRDANSEAARALAKAGAEVVAADLDDAESMKKAFDGAYGAYCVTFYWAHKSPEKELEQAQTLANSAKRAAVQHVIWSTLEDTRKWVPLDDDRMPTLMEKYKVPHYDAKGEADQYFHAAGAPTTYLLTSFYWDNFIYFGSGPKRAEDGTLILALPMGDKKLPGIAAEDIGKCAFGVFKRGNDLTGKRVGIAGEHLSGAEMAEKMSRALGEPVRYYDIEPEIFRGLGFPGADDIGNMFQFKRDFNEDYRRPRDVEFARSLDPQLQTFDMWLEKNANKIPIESPI